MWELTMIQQQRYGGSILSTPVRIISQNSAMAMAVASLSAALIACTISHPFDTIKTCMQGDIRGENYKSVTHTSKKLIEESGVRAGLFKGLGLRSLLVATTFFLVNQIKEKLAPVMFPHVKK